MVSSINTNYLTGSQVLAVQHVIIRIGLEFLFFGIHALLFIVSTWLLFQKGIGLVRARILLLIITSVMFLASFGVIISDMMICLRQASSYGLNAPTTRELTFGLRLASEVLMRLNFLLGDVIVVWRTWVVWSHSLSARLLLAVCMLGTISTAIANATTAILVFVRNTPGPNTLSLVLTLPPFITNSVATSLIAVKAWYYRKQIKSMLTTSTTSRMSSTRVEQVFILLVESGFVYCAVWLLILIAGFDVMTPANNTLICGIAVSLTGIYPTFIVIMVSLGKSHANTVFSSPEEYSTSEISQPLHFPTSGPARQSNESESPLPGENKDNSQQASLHSTGTGYDGGEPLHWAGSAKSLELQRHQGRAM
ncbi:hypothetical protein E1B28_002850 [Marasmius oreades]|uniref:Uncharacterized protein n=1 Tax=Marasmius oreades TaxID=181124 RepID=A0A9P7RNQ5_9AGAR|nr:uncharacterized protein E1B28_002850 [Marasmius oreades]KAG7086934.1 hypothetical protein E1B28_002850 [Marasmius oreades]